MLDHPMAETSVQATVAISENYRISFGPAFLHNPSLPDCTAFRAALPSKRLQAFYDIWDGLRDGAGVPTRQALRPHRFRSFLDSVGLLDYRANGKDFVFRLVGERLRDRFGRNVTGESLRRLAPGPDATFDRFWTQFLSEGRPRAEQGSLALMGRGHIRFLALHLPLAGPDGQVAHSFFFSEALDQAAI